MPTSHPRRQTGSVVHVDTRSAATSCRPMTRTSPFGSGDLSTRMCVAPSPPTALQSVGETAAALPALSMECRWPRRSLGFSPSQLSLKWFCHSTFARLAVGLGVYSNDCKSSRRRVTSMEETEGQKRVIYGNSSLGQRQGGSIGSRTSGFGQSEAFDTAAWILDNRRTNTRSDRYRPAFGF